MQFFNGRREAVTVLGTSTSIGVVPPTVSNASREKGVHVPVALTHFLDQIVPRGGTGRAGQVSHRRLTNRVVPGLGRLLAHHVGLPAGGREPEERVAGREAADEPPQDVDLPSFGWATGMVTERTGISPSTSQEIREPRRAVAVRGPVGMVNLNEVLSKVARSLIHAA
jgi:hypothetical protein